MPVTIERYLAGLKGSAFAVDAIADAENVGRILADAAEKNVLILGHNYMPPLIFALSDKGRPGRLSRPRPIRRAR